VLSGARLLLRQGMRLDALRIDREQLEQGVDLARRSLEQLEGLRQSLQEKLDGELARAEARWGEGQFEGLRRAAQKLADQLAEVEDLEAAMDQRLQGLIGAAGESGNRPNEPADPP
jgi:chromosome segregation ATPase